MAAARRAVEVTARRLPLAGALLLVSTTLTWTALPSPRAAGDPVALHGEGGTYASPIVDALLAGAPTAVSATYSELAGIDTARDDVAAGRSDFAVSELPLTPTEQATATAAGRSVAYVPFAAQALTLGFVLLRTQDSTFTPGVLYPTLDVSVATLAKMFTLDGVDSWLDPTISADNGGNDVQTVGETAITLAFSAEASAATSSLIDLFLSDPTARPIWEHYALAEHKSPDTAYETWVADNGVNGGERGLAETFHPLDTRNGQPNSNPQYMAQGYVGPLPMDWVSSPWDIPTLSVQNPAGAYVAPTPASMAASLADASVDPATGLVDFAAGDPDPAAYALPSVSYLVVPTTGSDPATATALAGLVRYVTGDTAQQQVAASGGVALPASMRAQGERVAEVLDAEAAPVANPTTTVTRGAPAAAPTTSPSPTTATTAPAAGPGPATTTPAARRSAPVLAAAPATGVAPTHAPTRTPTHTPVLAGAGPTSPGAGPLLIGLLPPGATYTPTERPAVVAADARVARAADPIPVALLVAGLAACGSGLVLGALARRRAGRSGR